VASGRRLDVSSTLSILDKGENPLYYDYPGRKLHQGKRLHPWSEATTDYGTVDGLCELFLIGGLPKRRQKAVEGSWSEQVNQDLALEGVTSKNREQIEVLTVGEVIVSGRHIIDDVA